MDSKRVYLYEKIIVDLNARRQYLEEVTGYSNFCEMEKKRREEYYILKIGKLVNRYLKELTSSDITTKDRNTSLIKFGTYS